MLAATTIRTTEGNGFPFLDGIPYSPLRIKRGHSVFHAGDAFATIYSIRFGSFKTCLVDSEGRQQVTGFEMQGDVLGLDGIATDRHDLTAVALEDSEVLALPFANVERAARENPGLQRHLHALLAREIVHDHGVIMLLGSLLAAERLAAFLLMLSRRYQRLGYSPEEFNFRMTRADIGSYLGLKIETISRMLTMFADNRLIEVHDKHIRLLDLDRLERTWKAGGAQESANDRAPSTREAIEHARTVQTDARNTRRHSAVARGIARTLRREREVAAA